MFYAREFFFRLKYSLFSILLSLIFCFKYKGTIFILFIFSILNITTTQGNFLGINHFIYTHPTELFNIYMIIILLVVFLFNFFYFMWQCLDFLKSSLYYSEYNKFVKFLISFFLIISILNYISFIYFFPKIWVLFNNFNQSLELNQSINFFFELKVYDYFIFIFTFIYYINLFLVILILLYILIKYLGLKELIKRKKLFILLNIVFATLLSPPDVYSQLMLLFLLTSLFEIFILIYVINLKFNTVIN